MDFRNKYLKYSPKITFDIFEKVWNKLIDSGYLPIGEYSVKKAFGDFKTLHRYFRTTESHPMEFNCYSVIPRLDWSETTVQEILGYDPFVKDDDFVLPERWCCKITEESIDVFNNWRISMSKSYLRNKIDEKYPYITSNGMCNYTTWGVEITFDQFKKYVLKQDVEENIKINYYKCIKSDFPELVLGKLYPSHDGKFVKIPHGEYTSCFYVNDGGRFELSNKSAFDAQNQPKQPQKQAVHCETKEQWDFVIEKVGYSLPKTDFYEYKSESCVILNSSNHYESFKWAAKENYQILSFSEWYAQNNYKLNKSVIDFSVSEEAANNLANAFDRIRYSLIQTNQLDMLKNLLKSFTCEIQPCEIQPYDYEFLAQMNGGKVSKVNKVQISTDNEIKINIIQKQSIKI